ncbi:ubiquitin carboxyl-terminal hydrolase-domain-containing protein [Bisporella sp. PMI_857]|nr:ubiquitin carboxyl-terminal hydrolase-domain-containing protein [Bisporella sp. PMI_857]
MEKLKKRLNIENIFPKEEQLDYALQQSSEDIDTAKALLTLFHTSAEGMVKPYDSSVVMRGAMNRNGVSCYMDSTLFAMFANLESFEPIIVLDKNSEDEKKNHLSMLIRVWVNMMRSGYLINIDITSKLQNALAACGWEPNDQDKQQDASEFFIFLTDKLQLPLLDLRMDLYYDSTKDSKDDHKVVQERLLDVAVPDEEPGRVIKLEECLENYFNNTVQVKRDLKRSDTVSSVQSHGSKSSEKEEALHIETRELTNSNPGTPISPLTPSTPMSQKFRRNRTDSLIATRVKLEQNEGREGETSTDLDTKPILSRSAKESKEVTTSAWQFFSLMPWYSRNTSLESGGEIAEYFKRTAPTLCIRLKRYTMENGKPARKNTPIDIPIDIRLPHFPDDDDVSDGPSLMQKFKLSLVSFICHRGISTEEGHYVSFIRGTKKTSDGDSTSDKRLSSSSLPPVYPVEQWIRHDDLSSPRVCQVDVEQALKDEMPFLLFYQVQQIYQDLADEPPSYEQISTIDVRIQESSPLEPKPDEGYFDRRSFEAEPRRSLNMPDDRRSAGYIDSEPENRASVPEVKSTPVTPMEETTAQRLSRAASKFRAGSRSRPTSRPGSSGDNRMSWFEGAPKKGRNSKEEPADPKKESKGKMPANTHGYKEKRQKDLPDRECAIM